jgi:hypothetical protein
VSNGTVFDWLTSNTEIDYPFDSRPSDGSYRLFVDAYVVHNNRAKAGQRLQLVTFDPTGICDLVFEDATLLANLTALNDFNVSVFGQYTLYRWQKSTTVGVGFTGEDLAVQIVVLTSQLANFIFPLSPPMAFLQASLVSPHQGRVRRMALALDGLSCWVGVTGEQVILEGGNNTDLSLVTTPPVPSLGILPTNSVRLPTIIKIDMTPGGGTGKLIDCNFATPPIKTIDQAGPNTIGNLDLTGEDCTWVERRITDVDPPTKAFTNYAATPVPATLQLHQDCKACCDCIDYGLAYTAIAALWGRAKKAAALIEAARKQYNILDAKVNSIKIITETGLKLKIQLVARPDFHLAIQLTAYLDSKFDINHNIFLEVQLDTFGFAMTQGSGIIDIAGGHKKQLDPIQFSTNQFFWIIPGLKSTGYAQGSFEIRYGPSTADFSGPVSRIGRVVTAYGQAAYGAVVVKDSTNVTLRGPLVKA